MTIDLDLLSWMETVLYLAHFRYNLFVTSKNEFSNSSIYEFKVLQNEFKIKKTRLKMFLKVIIRNKN